MFGNDYHPVDENKAGIRNIQHVPTFNAAGLLWDGNPCASGYSDNNADFYVGCSYCYRTTSHINIHINTCHRIFNAIAATTNHRFYYA